MAVVKRKSTSIKPKTKRPTPIKKSTPAQKAKMKQSYAKWSKSPAGKKYQALKKNPMQYKIYLMHKVRKILKWVDALKASKDPLKAKKVANHMVRVASLMAKIRTLGRSTK